MGKQASVSDHIPEGFHNPQRTAENKRIDDFFDVKEINDEQFMDFNFSMLDVGDEYGSPDRYKNEE